MKDWKKKVIQIKIDREKGKEKETQGGIVRKKRKNKRKQV